MKQNEKTWWWRFNILVTEVYITVQSIHLENLLFHLKTNYSYLENDTSCSENWESLPTAVTA